MPGERERLLAAFAAMQEANDQLRDELAHHKTATTAAIEDMLAESMTPGAVSAGAAPQIRLELTEALDRFERTRHEARLAIFAYLGTVPGVSTARIGRALGISRQLASRLAREASGSALDDTDS
ncbi:MAG TPA: hypothetical protein VKR22_12680 [Acidimicrobiales bacterium]|nr:hypothetical protein [Acidimicrobiales bacterium]